MELRAAVSLPAVFATESQRQRRQQQKPSPPRQTVDTDGKPMTPLSIEELHAITQGTLTMSSMPPRGGLWAPLGRLVCDSRQIQRGDVFWGLPGTCCDGSFFAEEALMRGAQGTIVSGRHVEPWAGCFSICVDDSLRSLRQVGQWSRRRFEGTVVHVHDFAAPGRLGQWTRQALNQDASSRIPSHCVKTETEAVLGMVNWDIDDECAIVETSRASSLQIDEISHLCCPHVLAINCTRKSTSSYEQVELLEEVQRKLCEALPSDGVVVVSGDNKLSSACEHRAAGERLWIGCSPECDLTATLLSSTGECLKFVCDGEKFEVPACQPDDLHRVLAAIGVTRVLGLPTRAVRDALRQPWFDTTDDEQSHTLEVSPSALALREDDATLPPGLERYAC